MFFLLSPQSGLEWPINHSDNTASGVFAYRALLCFLECIRLAHIICITDSGGFWSSAHKAYISNSTYHNINACEHVFKCNCVCRLVGFFDYRVNDMI